MDKQGYPAIIPLRWREILIKNDPSDDRLIVGILTCLTIFRCFPTNARESFKTLTDPFTGITRVFDLDLVRRAVRDLGITETIGLGK